MARNGMNLGGALPQNLERLQGRCPIDLRLHRPESLPHQARADREEGAVGVVGVERNGHPAGRRTRTLREPNYIGPGIRQRPEARGSP